MTIYVYNYVYKPHQFPNNLISFFTRVYPPPPPHPHPRVYAHQKGPLKC